MKKWISYVIMMSMLCSLLVVPAAALDNANNLSAEQSGVWIAPSTPTLINGEPEGELTISPRDVIMGPYFHEYVYDYTTVVDKFKTIAVFTRSNKLNTEIEPMSVTITSSTEQGSEWTGNITLTGEIKAKVLASIKGEVGVSYKSSRSVNEAVGFSTTHYIDPGKVGHIECYYRGYKIGGAVTTYTQYTATMEKAYSTNYLYSTVYQNDFLDIHVDAYDTDN